MNTISIIISVAGVVLAAATFLVGRLTAAAGKGKQDGAIVTRLDSIDSKLDDFGASIRRIETQQGEQRDRLTRLETKVEMYHNGGAQ